MKTCPYCAEDIQNAAVVCKHCGRNLEGGTAGNQAEKRPWIGLLGLVLLVVGLAAFFCSGGSSFGVWTSIIGGAVLAYAILSGNTKVFG